MTHDLPAHPRHDWTGIFRELARLTHGIEPDDFRLFDVMTAMHTADDCFKAGDWVGFQRAANEVRRIVEGKDIDAG